MGFPVLDLPEDGFHIPFVQEVDEEVHGEDHEEVDDDHEVQESVLVFLD